MSAEDTQPQETTAATTTFVNIRYLDAIAVASTDLTHDARVTVRDGDVNGVILWQGGVVRGGCDHKWIVFPRSVISISGNVYVSVLDPATGANTASLARVIVYTH